MNSPNPQTTEVYAQFSALCDGSLTDAQLVELNHLLQTDRKVRLEYIRYMQMDAHLHRLFQTGWTLVDSGQFHHLDQLLPGDEESPVTQSPEQTMHDAMILPALHYEVEGTQPQETPAVRLIERPRRKPPAPPRTPFMSRYRRAFYACAAAIMLVISITIVLLRPVPSFSRIVQSVNVEWGPGGVPRADRNLPAVPMFLKRGTIELEFTGGARAIISGPAHFTADSASHMQLATGRVSAVVKDAARGFSITTRTAIVTDLGTEFGVYDTGASTDIHVFKGTVNAAKVSEPSKPQTLTTGNAVSVDSHGVTPIAGGAVRQLFVRKMDTGPLSLDVTDLIAGGDGTTLLRGKAIDLTGSWGQVEAAGLSNGDHAYHRPQGIPVVDGCLVPDGSIAEVPIDSAGDLFKFPVTSNQCYNNIVAGGAVAVPDGTSPTNLKLGGIDYGAFPHGFLFMSSNRALTIDLNAIRGMHPGHSLLSFRCKVGNSNDTMPHDAQAPKADIYVIVDGLGRYQRNHIVPADGAMEINVHLSEKDRFLTLAVTDGGDGITCDGILWGDPMIDAE